MLSLSPPTENKARWWVACTRCVEFTCRPISIMHSLHVFPTYRLAWEVPRQSSLQANGDGEQAGQWGQTWDENWRGILLSPEKVNWTQEIIYAHSKLRSIYWSIPRYESLTSMHCVDGSYFALLQSTFGILFKYHTVFILAWSNLINTRIHFLELMGESNYDHSFGCYITINTVVWFAYWLGDFVK